MYDHPRNDVSPISEIPVINGVGHFAAALGWGVLAGTAALGFWLLIFADFDIDLGEIVGVLLFLSIFVGAFTLAGMVVIGLPTTFILRTVGQENASLYAALGAIAGFLVLAVLFDSPANPEWIYLPASGALAGFACAWRWGRWRERVARTRQETAKRRTSKKRDNPIHCLIH